VTAPELELRLNQALLRSSRGPDGARSGLKQLLTVTIKIPGAIANVSGSTGWLQYKQPASLPPESPTAKFLEDAS